MNLQKLKAVLDTGEPFADDAAALVFMKADVTRKNDVSWTDFMLWLYDTEGVVNLETAKASGATDAIKNAAGLALLVASAGKELTLSRNDVRLALGPLVGPVFTVDEKDDLLALSNEAVPRWEAEGFRKMDDASKTHWISKARAL